MHDEGERERIDSGAGLRVSWWFARVSSVLSGADDAIRQGDACQSVRISASVGRSALVFARRAGRTLRALRGRFGRFADAQESEAYVVGNNLLASAIWTFRTFRAFLFFS